MTERTNDKELEALKADIARLREEIAGLTAGAKDIAGAKTAGAHDDVARAATGEEALESGEQGFGVFADLLHKLDTSRIQGEKVIKGLADEVEGHPLAGFMVAFGLGYIIAKLWHQGDKQ
jgi:hypothetical protein